MRSASNKQIRVYAILLGIILIGMSIIPVSLSLNVRQGFENGIPWQSFVPVKKTVFVQFDKDSYVDDYAYLASIPASVFSDGNLIYTSPLLFFQEDGVYPDEDKYRFLNDYMGIHYLMEDWMNYCNGKLDKLITINVDEDNLEDSWKTREHTVIDSDDPFEIASEVALDEWSYSDDAVIAVIEEEFEKPVDSDVEGMVNGEISGEIGRESLKINRPYGPSSEYEKFQIDEEYKYVEVDLWYPAIVYYSKLIGAIPGFPNPTPVTLPSVDPDLQIYCEYDGDWLQTNAAAEMAITHGPHEEVFSYVYEPGNWRVGVTNMPTEGGDESFANDGRFGKVTVYGSLIDALKSLFKGVDEFNIEVTKYPGVEVEIPDTPSIGCRDGVFELSWENDKVDLGLTIIGPSGEEIESVMEKDTDSQKIEMKLLGECLENEHYKAVVYALDDISAPVDFEVSYSWQQNISQKEADLLSSACQGAILGSIENSPLLFVTPDSLPTCTENTLLKLGVKQVNIVDLGGYLSEDTLNDIKHVVNIKKNYQEYNDIYSDITQKTGSTDVVFSTIDPWSYWYYYSTSGDLKPDGEYTGAFYFGPAAYAAANHGTPLLLVDNHPELSGAMTWNVNFWQKNADGFTAPPVACMFLTGTRVYDFLRDYGFDTRGVESILTVAGQYEIGPTWTRMLTGVANPGNIIGTPVDTSVHISKCIFYPGLIFENPALQGEVELESGSESVRVFHVDHPFRIFEVLLSRISQKTPGFTNLKILKESAVEKFVYPVLHTYGCYCHRVNERASDYWGVSYQTRRGYTPNVDISGEEIDQGTRLKYEGISGSFLPDLTVSEFTPFYAAKAGYSNAYSTDFDITMDNLNQGVISWYMVLHGMSFEGGELAWWQPISQTLQDVGVSPSLANLLNKIIGVPLGLNPYEVNPWRAYDQLWGSTEEPDSAVLNSEIGLIPGWTNVFRIRDLLDKGLLKTGLDIVPSHLAGYYDGQVGPYSITAMFTKFRYSHPATEIDDKLENLHSMNFHAGSCLIGCNYLQIMFMRHGSVLQEMDPWPTSYWSNYVIQQIPRDFAIGKTVGETYSHGITEVGPQYVFEEDDERVWWWDNTENIVLFADPDLRIWVPSDEYDFESRNHWEKEDIQSLRYESDLDIDGHMPFMVTEYPNERQPTTLLEEYLIVIIVIVLILLLLLGIIIGRKKK